MWPPPLGIFRGVADPSTACRTRGITEHGQYSLRNLYRELMPTLFDQRLHGLDGPRHQRLELDDFLAQVDLAAGNPRHIQQIVHQPCQVSELPSDDVTRPGELRIRERLGDA